MLSRRSFLENAGKLLSVVGLGSLLPDVEIDTPVRVREEVPSTNRMYISGFDVVEHQGKLCFRCNHNKHNLTMQWNGAEGKPNYEILTSSVSTMFTHLRTPHSEYMIENIDLKMDNKIGLGLDLTGKIKLHEYWYEDRVSDWRYTNSNMVEMVHVRGLILEPINGARIIALD